MFLLMSYCLPATFKRLSQPFLSVQMPVGLPLIVPLFESFYDTCDLLSRSAGKGGNNVLGRRLEQTDDIPDKLFAALDGYEHVEVLVADINTILYVCSLEHRFPLRVLLTELLDDLCRSFVYGGEHNRSRAAEHSDELLVGLVGCLQCFLEKGILHDHEIYLLFEALTAECRSLLGVEFGYVRYVEMRVFVELGGQRLYYLSFSSLFIVFGIFISCQ